MKSVLLLSAALIAPATTVLAQDRVLIADLAETTVVSATRIPTPVSQVASSVTVITAADIPSAFG